MKKLFVVGLTSLSLMSAPALRATDENPNNTKDHVSSIAWVVARDNDDDIGVDDRYVVLIGKVTEKQIREIATQKMPDLNASSVETAMKSIKGTARSMGIEVVA